MIYDKITSGGRITETTTKQSVAMVSLRYLKAYADGREAKAGIAAWITFYNELRFHQALGHRTPMRVWREGRALAASEGLWR